MALFDKDLFDEAIFDVGGEGSTSANPLYQSRWLLTLDVSGRVLRYSDLAGEVFGDLYRAGIANVSVGESGIDLEQRSFVVGNASIDLVPDPYGLDPRHDLRRAKARLSLLVKGVVIDLLEAPVRDVRRGRSWVTGHPGEVHSFRLTEEFSRNPTFPPRVADAERFGATRIDPSAEGHPLTEVYGDALTVPMFAVRSLVEPDGALQYHVCGHRLRGGRVAPSNGMPWSVFPDRSDLQPNQVVGIWIGRNRGVRDPLRDSLHGGWVTSGTVTPGATGTVVAAAGELRWNAWRFIPAVSWRFHVENAGAGSGVDRGFRFVWGWRDAENHLRAVFNVDANTVKVEVLKENSVDWTSEVFTPSPALSDSQTEYRIIVDDSRNLTIGIGDQRLQVGEIPGIHHGYFAFVSDVEDHRFAALGMPHESPRNLSLANLNTGFATATDLLGDRYVVEQYDEDVSLPLYAETHAAQGVSTAGELYRDLVLRHSGYTHDEIDEASFGAALAVIPLRIGSWFAQEAKLFDLIQQRLAPQFLAWVSQEAGRLRITALDPNAPAAQHLRLHRDLLEAIDQPQQMPDRTRFEIRYRWRENLAGGPGYARREQLGPDDVPALRAHEGRLPGPVQYPTIETVDVLHDATARQILLRYATLYWQGEEVPYLRRTVPKPLRYGTVVDITDEPNGYDHQRAVLLRRRYESPDFMVETYRTVHPLDDPIVAGVTLENECRLVFREPWDTLSDWTISGSGSHALDTATPLDGASSLSVTVDAEQEKLLVRAGAFSSGRIRTRFRIDAYDGGDNATHGIALVAMIQSPSGASSQAYMLVLRPGFPLLKLFRHDAGDPDTDAPTESFGSENPGAIAVGDPYMMELEWRTVSGGIELTGRFSLTGQSQDLVTIFDRILDATPLGSPESVGLSFARSAGVGFAMEVTIDETECLDCTEDT